MGKLATTTTYEWTHKGPEYATLRVLWAGSDCPRLQGSIAFGYDEDHPLDWIAFADTRQGGDGFPMVRVVGHSPDEDKAMALVLTATGLNE